MLHLYLSPAKNSKLPLGAYGPQGIKLVKQIGKKIQDSTSEKLSTFYLFQSISMAVQKGNAALCYGFRLREPIQFSST